MKLNEIGENTNIIIEAHLGAECVSFSSSVKLVKKGGLVIDVIKHEGKMVNLHSEKLNIYIICEKEEGAPDVWKNCKIQQIIYKNQLHELVTCINDSEKLNRRNNSRVQVGSTGKVTGKSKYNCFSANIHDVSEKGFSIITPREIDNYMDYPLCVQFSDPQVGSELDIKGKIVRREQIDEENFLYGCVITIPVKSLNKYILEKQRMEKVYRLNNNRLL